MNYRIFTIALLISFIIITTQASASELEIKIDCDGDTIFEQTDGTIPRFFDYLTVPNNVIMPGDSGNVLIGLYLNEDGIIYMDINNLINTDTITTEPEAIAENGIQVNALSDKIDVLLWEDDGDGVYDESCEKSFFDDTLTKLENEEIEFEYDNPIYVGFSWTFNTDAGNEYQNDKTNFDVTFHAQQSTTPTSTRSGSKILGNWTITGPTSFGTLTPTPVSTVIVQQVTSGNNTTKFTIVPVPEKTNYLEYVLFILLLILVLMMYIYWKSL